MIKVYSSPVNQGKGAAVRLGLCRATGDLLLIQDADLELNREEYRALLAPILSGEAKVVYGSRFLGRNQPTTIPRRTRWANRLLTSLTNILFNCNLTDMETVYKLFPRETLTGSNLRAVRFNFEPEITGHFLKSGYEIREVPITYSPRRANEGKKVSWFDGIEAVYTLFRVRFFT